MLVYKLAPVLGGRREVLETPFVDCLGYLIAEFEKTNKSKRRGTALISKSHFKNVI